MQAFPLLRRRTLVRSLAALVVAIVLLVATAALAQEAAEGVPPGDVAAPVAEKDPIQVTSLMEMILAGGPMMLPIFAGSAVLLVFVFERAVALRRRRVIPKPFVKRFLHQLREGQLDRDAALELCEANRSPVSEVFAAAVRKWGRPAVEVEQAVLDSGERITNGLRRYLRVINGVATVSPLLGLLGTVWGMIQSFNAIATANAMGRPELLAGGISQALLTTAAGLVVAIPALIFYMFFVGRVDRLIIEIDAVGQELVGLISAEGLEELTRPRKSTPKKRAAA